MPNWPFLQTTMDVSIGKTKAMSVARRNNNRYILFTQSLPTELLRIVRGISVPTNVPSTLQREKPSSESQELEECIAMEMMMQHFFYVILVRRYVQCTHRFDSTAISNTHKRTADSNLLERVDNPPSRPACLPA